MLLFSGDTISLLVYFFGLVCLLGLQIFLIRWVFKVDTQVNNQQAMIQLLIKQCRKQGVNPKDLDAIKNFYNIQELGSESQDPSNPTGGIGIPA